MSVSYLHGVESVESEVGGQTINVVKSAVLALIGIAPIGPVNALTLCNNPADDAQFGVSVPGFNIPKSLEIIRAIAGNSPILVVNVFDNVANVSPVTNESQTVTGGKLKLAFSPLGAVTVKNADGTTPAPIVLNTDYTIDAFGNFQVISANIADGTTYKFSYSKLNASAVTTSQIIGGIDNTTSARTGISLFDLAFNTYGFNPKVFLTPNYSSLSSIASALATASAKFRAIYLLDAPAGTTINGAIAGRGISGSLVFNTSDERAYLLFPYLKTFDDYSQADAIFPYSAFMAGVIVKSDLNNGYWFSPSNQVISNATGIETPIQWQINDPNSEANLLNGAGITTVATGFGTGILAWGNRNASFPTSTSEKNFVAVRRVTDMVIESIELASLPYMDKPLAQAQVDTIREAGNTFIRTLIQRGAVLPGSKVVYNKSDNSSSELANGHVTFQIVYNAPTPTERITYDFVLDTSLLNQFN